MRLIRHRVAVLIIDQNEGPDILALNHVDETSERLKRQVRDNGTLLLKSIFELHIILLEKIVM